MDFGLIIGQLLSSFWFLIPLAILLALFKSPRIKGILGEFFVHLILKLRLPRDTYHLIKDVTLPTEDGTTQIDHILVSKYGIFVIETKNMKGWIFGSSHQNQWTQKIYQHTSRFQNPVRQNYKHIKTIEKLLNIHADSIFSVIVFIGDSTFKTEMPDNVTYAGGCIRYIKSHAEVIFTTEQVLEIVSAIEGGRLQRGFQTNQSHIKHVKEIIEAKQKPSPVANGAMLCPRCDSTMVLRQAKKGANAEQKFWGCSAFPKCRAVVELELPENQL